MAGLDMSDQCLGKPGRELIERIARRRGESNPLQRLVAPQGFDQRGSGPIRACRDVPNEGSGFERDAAARERPDDEQALARLKVEAHLDGEVPVNAKGVFEISHVVTLRFHGPPFRRQ